MVKKPQISILMPLFNKRPYVKRSIDSILQQSYPDWELIIVDDGSTDNSSEKVPKNDNRIKLFRQKNSGPSSARNYALKESSGKYISFVDADDIYYPNKLVTEVQFLLKENKADWMISAFHRESKGEKKYNGIFERNSDKEISKPSLYEDAFNKLRLGALHINGLCLNRNLLVNLGGFREDMHCFEITELIIRCALKQPVVFIYPLPLCCIVDVPDSAFKNSRNRLQGTRKMGETQFRLSKKYNESSELLKSKSKDNLFTYVLALIRMKRKAEARRYLINKYPFCPNKDWLKLFLLSTLPYWAHKLSVRRK